MLETKPKAEEAKELTPEQRAQFEQQMAKIIRLRPTIDREGEPMLAVALNLPGVLLMLGSIHRGIVLAEQKLAEEKQAGKTPEDEMNAKLAAALMARSQAYAFDQGAKAFLEANPRLVKANPAAQRMLDEVLAPIPTTPEEKPDGS